MKMIFKYPLGEDIHHNAIYEIEMPKGAKILDIQLQAGKPVIWALVNPKHKLRKYEFQIAGTGFELLDYDKRHFEYIKTIQAGHLAALVWHIFLIHE